MRWITSTTTMLCPWNADVGAPRRGQTTEVGRRGLGPTDHNEQRTHRLSYETVHAAAAAAVWAMMLGSKSIPREAHSARPFTARLDSVSTGSDA